MAYRPVCSDSFLGNDSLYPRYLASRQRYHHYRSKSSSCKAGKAYSCPSVWQDKNCHQFSVAVPSYCFCSSRRQLFLSFSLVVPLPLLDRWVATFDRFTFVLDRLLFKIQERRGINRNDKCDGEKGRCRLISLLVYLTSRK